MFKKLIHSIKHLSLRYLTILGSTVTVVVFLSFYFSYKIFWKHDQDVEHSLKRQMFEIERVETVLQMEELELRASIEDYAAWTSMANYVQAPTDEFINDSIGAHAFISSLIDSAIIFSPHGDVVWYGTFDGEHVINRSLVDLDNPTLVNSILSAASSSSRQQIESFVQYARIKDSAAMIASSRICLSDATECDYGYLVFIRKVRKEFLAQLVLATGVDIKVLPPTAPQVAGPNTYILTRPDVLSSDAIRIQVTHNEKLPPFFSWQGVLALSVFSLIMFVVNLQVMNFFIKPFIKAQHYLKRFQQSGGSLPSEEAFISKEARDFARQLNSVISELEENRALLKKQSTIDSLTGIANRRYLYDTANSFIEQEQYHYIGVVIVDVDHFKLYNDTYGHIAGDQALIQVAQTLNSVHTPYQHLVARYGGEEFCIIIASDTPIELEPYVKQLVTSVREKKIPHSQSVTADCITVSAGATTAHIDHYGELSFMIQTADRALYQVKANGRNHYKIEPKHDLSPV